jgi:hypothetical protein
MMDKSWETTFTKRWHLNDGGEDEEENLVGPL